MASRYKTTVCLHKYNTEAREIQEKDPAKENHVHSAGNKYASVFSQLL